MSGKFQEELAARRKATEQLEKRNKKGVPDPTELYAFGVASDGKTPPGWYKPRTEPHQAASGGWDKSLIPEVPPAFERTPSDDSLDEIVRNLPVTQAYRRWIPKGEPEIRYNGQVESIMIRCPFPDHVDNTPSAWCNTEKNVWVCTVCDYGGDIFDLAAIHFGLPVPGYKKNGQFPKLRQLMAQDFGITVVRGINGKEYTVQAEPAPPPVAAPSVPAPRVQIPGVQSFAMPVFGGQAKPSQAPQPVAPVVPPITPTPVEPPAPIQIQPTVAETQATPVVPTPPQQAPPAPQQPGIAIPGVQSVAFPPVAGQAFSGVVIPPPQVQQQAPGQAVQQPSPVVFTLPPSVIVTPRLEPVDPSILREYGLTAEGEDDGTGGFGGIALPWREMTPGGTFLDKYMALTTQDESPEEFHYFSAMIALGLAAGNDVLLKDRRPVKSNIFVCFLGKSGEGKSNSKTYLNDLFSKAMPYDFTDPINKGVNSVANPGSSEFMVKQFMKQVKDINNPGTMAEQFAVRGLIEFDELATLMKRAKNPSSTLAQFLIEFYDAKYEIKTGSLTHGGFVAREPFASSISTTQPRVLRSIIDDEHVSSGFLNRWIFATGKPKELIPFEGEVLSIDPLVKPLQKVFAWAGGVHELVGWEPAALELAREFVVNVIRPIKRADEADIYSRIDLLFKKMILLNTINLGRTAVPAQAVQWAIMAHKYLMQTYQSLDRAVHNTSSEELRKSVMKAILGLTTRNNRPPSMKQILKEVGTRQFSVEEINRCVTSLERAGVLEELAPDNGPGRKCTRFHITSSQGE